jgi:hypothetical protein
MKLCAQNGRQPPYFQATGGALLFVLAEEVVAAIQLQFCTGSDILPVKDVA